MNRRTRVYWAVGYAVAFLLLGTVVAARAATPAPGVGSPLSLTGSQAGNTQSVNCAGLTPAQLAQMGSARAAAILARCGDGQPAQSSTNASETPALTSGKNAPAQGTPTPTPACNPNGAVVLSGAITSSDPTHNSVLGATSSCAVSPACPGQFAGTFHYDAYTLTNPSDNPVCITVTLSDNTCIYSESYLGSFDPNNSCTNYLADSNQASSYSYTVPAHATFVVVAEEYFLNQGCSSYTLTVTGLPSTCATPSATAAAPSATRTRTPVPPTLTPTAVPPTLTRTPVPPTLTPTAIPPTLTRTPVPPTLTPTAVRPTLTSTAVPPTQTATRTPVPPTATSTTCVTETPLPIITPAFTPGPGCSSTPPAGVLSAVITDHPTTTSALFTNNSATCSYPIGLAVYRKVDNTIDHQVLYDYALAVIPPHSSLTLTVNNPTCAYQGDAFYDNLIVSFAGGVRYGTRRLDDTDGNGTNYCSTQCLPPPPPTLPPPPPTLPPPPPTLPPPPPTVPPTTVPCSLCNVYISDLNIACNGDGSYHWTATVRNNASCTVNSTWQDQLQIQRNYGGWHTVLTQTGSGSFPPGDTTIGGDFCYRVPPNTTGVRHVFKLTGNPPSCRPDPISPSIAPCPGQPTCAAAPGADPAAAQQP